MKHGKKYIESAKLIESSKLYDPDEAVKLALQTAKTKFDETMEISVRLGVDPRQADQQVRGAVVLPHGTGKKVRVATEIAAAVGLKNVTTRHCRAEEEKQRFDFVVSRAVMPLTDLLKIIRKNISKEQRNALPNGLICLKGGELEKEVFPVKHQTLIHDLKEDFTEEFFETKKVVYVTINGQ